MPEVTLVRDTAPELLPMTGRSEGIHVSEIIHDICVRMGHYEPREMNRARAELGNALETAIAIRMQEEEPDRYIRLGELTLDDIHGTPDLYDQVDNADTEIKLSWMSMKNGPGSTKFWKYEAQNMSYCRMLDLTRGKLHVVFVDGEHKYDDDGSRWREWHYRYSKRELSQHWTMMCRHRDRMLRERRRAERQARRNGTG